MNKTFDKKLSKLMEGLDSTMSNIDKPTPKNNKKHHSKFKSHHNKNKKQNNINKKKPNDHKEQNKNTKINKHRGKVNKNKEIKNSKQTDLKQVSIKPLKKETLRIIPIGGVEEVGKNCTVFEYGDDMIIVDMGLQFPPEDMHGVQYIIPDYSYLEKYKNKIKGIIITHAHLDHIGAIPYITEVLGNKIPIYGSDLTCKIIEKRQSEFRMELPLRHIKAKDKIVLGNFRLEFCHVNHTVPGCLAISITTPIGTVVTLGDWKIDYAPVGEQTADLRHIASIGQKNVLALLADSTNAYKDGYQKSETEVMNTLESVYQKATGRIIVGTFSSSLSRIQQIVLLAEKYNRKVFFAGYSMRTNVGIAKDLKYLRFNQNTLIQQRELKSLPDSKVVIACTGVQGEENAALGRIAADKHPDISIQPGDNIIFSSSVIPGNERPVQSLLDKIYKRGAKVIRIQEMAVHSGGHAKAEEVKLMYNLLKPQYYIPVHGNYFLLSKHKELIESIGHPSKDILIPENGLVIEFNKSKAVFIGKEKAPNDIIAIDGLGVGDLSKEVLGDRRLLADSGVFVVILNVNKSTFQLIGKPKFVSHGFINNKTSEKLLQEIEKTVIDIYNSNIKMASKNINELTNKIRKDLKQFLYKSTERSPIVSPIILKV